MSVLSPDSCSEAKTRRRYYFKKDNVCLYLNESELHCLRYILQGKSYAEVAEVLNLSAHTIEFYSQTMQAKLSCSDCESLIEFFKKKIEQNSLSWL